MRPAPGGVRAGAQGIGIGALAARQSDYGGLAGA
jgi:hypothetical protein